jgi:hypothetical protein
MAQQRLDQLVLFQAQITGTVWAQVDIKGVHEAKYDGGNQFLLDLLLNRP